jgi:hypothetical protein
VGLADSAAAATITVGDTNDAYGGATCSLRNAVKSVNTGVAYGGCHFTASLGQMIVVPAGTFRITRPIDVNDPYAGGGLLVGNVTVRISGAGADKTVIDGNGVNQIFHLSGIGAAFYLNDAELRAGFAFAGGAIRDDGQGLTLSIDRVLLRHNRASTLGGAVYNSDPSGVLVFTHSSIVDNESDSVGGAVYLSAIGSMTIENVTISGNRAANVGGIAVENGTGTSAIRLNNVTIAENSATHPSSAIATVQGGAGLFVHSAYPGSVRIGNSILARNVARGRNATTNYSPDCIGARISSDDYNLFGTGLATGCSISGSTLRTLFDADPKLLSLFNYGGHLPTQAIPPDSPAHDNGNPASCASDDERGVSRSSDICDMGAYEFRADYTVNSTLDANDAVADGVCDSNPPNRVCTLRAALDEANAATSSRTIVVPAGIYVLFMSDNGNPNSGALFVDNQDATLILGAGANQTRIGKFSVGDSFNARSTLALAHLAVSGNPLIGIGQASGSIVVAGSSALLEEVSVTGARSCNGGGVQMTGGNGAELRIERSTIAYNYAIGCGPYDSGGGVYVNGANVYIRNSTISHNRAESSGGGIFAHASTVYLSQNTIADNTANLGAANLGSGGGIAFDPLSGGSFVMAGTVLANNRRGTGLNTSADDCAALLSSHDENLIGNTAGCTLTGSLSNTLQNVDPQLSSLALQGGATPTQGLRMTSPAVNAVGDDHCIDVFGNAIATDQRAIERATTATDLTSLCDIGAVEGISNVIFADGYD